MKRKKDTRPLKEDFYYDIEETVSTTEQTGLIPTPPLNDAQADAYEELSPIHRQKPLK